MAEWKVKRADKNGKFAEIYKLCFSNGKSYVGCTTNGLMRRFLAHKSNMKRGLSAPLYDAWREFGEPKIVLVATVIIGQAEKEEQAAISKFKTMQPTGYNARAGGRRGAYYSEEAKLKHSKIMKLRASPSQESIAKVASKLKGRKLSEAHRAKMSAAAKGREFSAETRAKISAAHIGRKKSPEAAAASAAARKGLSPSTETRAKLSIALKKYHTSKRISYAKR